MHSRGSIPVCKIRYENCDTIRILGLSAEPKAYLNLYEYLTSLHNTDLLSSLDAKQLISGRRHECMNLHNTIQGFSTSECDWLLPRGKRGSVHHLNQSMAEMKKRRELLEEFLFWYFDQFLIPLLRVRHP